MAGGAVDRPPANVRAELHSLAEAHRVMPLAAWRINERGEALHDWFDDASSLAEDLRRRAAIDLMRTHELRDLVDHMHAIDGARPILIKGAALAHTHYPESWLRPRLDTDMLVSPRSADAVRKRLREIGYEPVPSTSGELVMSQAAFDRIDAHGLTHPLDLHWRISNWHVVGPLLPHDDVADRSVCVPALGPHARAACPVDALVLACLHRAAHHRDSDELLWLYDIHVVATGLTADEWRNVEHLAERTGTTAVCARGLQMARNRFRTPLAAAIAERLSAWAGNATTEPAAVYLSRTLSQFDGLRADLRALPPRGRLRLLREHLFPPVSYIREKYGTRSHAGIGWSYMRRILAGVPKWFARAPRS